MDLAQTKYHLTKHLTRKNIRGFGTLHLRLGLKLYTYRSYQQLQVIQVLKEYVHQQNLKVRCLHYLKTQLDMKSHVLSLIVTMTHNGKKQAKLITYKHMEVM